MELRRCSANTQPDNECVIKALIGRFLHSLYSKPVPEHDVVPEGPVDVQVDLFYLC